MHESEAPEPLRKPEPIPPEVMRQHDYSGSTHQFPGPYTSAYYGPADTISRADYATMSSASHVGTQYPLHDDRPRSVCGIKRSTFILSLVLSFIVIGAAVGGAAGGSLAVQPPVFPLKTDFEALVLLVRRASACPSNSLETSGGSATSSYLSIPTSGVSVALDCQKLNGNTQAVVIGDETRLFKLTCGQDYHSRQSQDLMGLTSYTMESCLHACVAYNLARNSSECVAAVFIADVSYATDKYGGNCWIKNGTKDSDAALYRSNT
ncbi:hypothetical protein PG997_012645 [Apiospora hydei]|uniref:Apple domain-containing protein n=1 Tax=Apiospora hydei TaxID=1337664 RepID=A0ABR1V7C9_9PEZI